MAHLTATRALPTVGQFLPPDNNAVGSAAHELRRKTEDFFLQKIRESIYQKATARLAALQLRISSLEQLGQNWDSYGAPPPNATAARNISRILKLLSPFEIGAAQILPSAEGGLAICFVRGNRYADIECSNNGDFVGVRYVGRDLPAVIEIQGTEASLQAALEEVRNHISG